MKDTLTCCFTGHRPQDLGFAPGSAAETALKNRLAGETLRLITEQNVRHFISGMALGVDTYAAQAVLKLKELYPEITLECALPCKGQDRRWKKADRDEYASLLDARNTWQSIPLFLDSGAKADEALETYYRLMVLKKTE